ncbi:MAG: hypothetical protein ACYTAF_05905 [Planctomycetota bacterium]|jgi:hypothetical protein
MQDNIRDARNRCVECYECRTGDWEDHRKEAQERLADTERVELRSRKPSYQRISRLRQAVNACVNCERRKPVLANSLEGYR